jgi:hypothetical protein
MRLVSLRTHVDGFTERIYVIDDGLGLVYVLVWPDPKHMGQVAALKETAKAFGYCARHDCDRLGCPDWIDNDSPPDITCSANSGA